MYKLRVCYEKQSKSTCGEIRNGEKMNVHGDMSGMRKKEREMNEMSYQVRE